MFYSIRNFMENDAVEALAKTVEKVKASLHYGVSLEAKALEGQAINTICNYSKQMEESLIVMGTQGATGLKEVFIGSNTTGVIRKSKVPVLAIPSGYEYRPFKKIAFAVDSSVVSSANTIEALVQIAKSYNSKVELFQVGEKNELPLVDVGLDIYLSDVNRDFYFIENEDINIGINDFVEKKHCDLLCMTHRHRGFLSNVFHKSITLKEAFNSPVPLLVLMSE